MPSLLCSILVEVIIVLRTLRTSKMNMMAPAASSREQNRRPFADNQEMGRQSQQRKSNSKRAYDLASSNPFPKKSKQTTFKGDAAFDPIENCKRCRNKFYGLPEYKKAHHVLCIHNTKTRGRGNMSKHALACEAESERLKKHFSEPPKEHEKGRASEVTPENLKAFFTPRRQATYPSTSIRSQHATSKVPTNAITGDVLCKGVNTLLGDASFVAKHEDKRAPVAMIAFASQVMDWIVRPKNGAASTFQQHFDGITMVVPAATGNVGPQYHSIIGQKLLLVDWSRIGVTVNCPDQCGGLLTNDRTNFSKNKMLFPIFGLEGAPQWCMVQSMTCLCCKRRFEANSADVLLSIPAYAAALYPVETKYALRNNCHLARNTTDVFESLIVTYGNGDLCSKLLYNAINRDYLRRVTTYYSFAVDKTNRKNVQQYLTKDGQFIRCFPPLGETIRDIYDQASSTAMNPWGISDKERHTREMQSVSCENGIFCQDHTFQAVRNYRKSLGAVAIWDVATSTGEIAAAVLVPSTKTKTFSHAAKQLSRRASFTPQAMYSDTWPNKDKYWESLFPNLQGRLGLFHFEKRIISTLKKQHIDYLRAINDLLMCLYEYCAEDYEQLLRALKDGTLNGKQHSSTDIADLQATKQFRDRYSKYLRKQMRQPQTMIQLLDDWFCRYKVTSSDPLNKPAKGRLDPYRNIALFTPETKSAVKNCKEKAIYLGDPLPLDQMYDKIKRSPNAEHNLVEYLSKRGESKLEAYHDRAAHFANTGMRSSLCDNLNLCGTARYNLAIRQKRALISSNDSDRKEEYQRGGRKLFRFGITPSCGLSMDLPVSWLCRSHFPWRRGFHQTMVNDFSLSTWHTLNPQHHHTATINACANCAKHQ
jgi:hypothetical protein